MDVKTADETAFSLRTAIRYTAITTVLLGLLLLPAAVFPSYPRLLNTLLLLALLGLVGRAFLSALLSFRRIEPPANSLDDGDMPRVSVLVPAYNEEPVLPKTIEACKELDYPAERLEVILCYEADSTDRTAEICEAAAADDERFRAVKRDEPGGGKAKATNYALRYATGEIIASVDADHCFKPDAVRRAVAWFEADPDVYCVKGRCYGRNPTDSLLALHATLERHIAEKADLYAREVLDSFTIFGGGQAFFRASAFEELGTFDAEILVEDVDMSSRIHAAGKTLHVDPGVITFEENPATLSAWWSQRKRWARGWMQVAVRYIYRLPASEAVSWRTRLDALYTFLYALVPAFVIVGLPLYLMGNHLGMEVTTYLPHGWLLWTLIGLSPPLVSILIFVQDWRDSLRHHPAEYLASLTLWFYLVFQTTVFVAAFIEEFVLRKPSIYVTTSRTDAPSDD